MGGKEGEREGEKDRKIVSMFDGVITKQLINGFSSNLEHLILQTLTQVKF